MTAYGVPSVVVKKNQVNMEIHILVAYALLSVQVWKYTSINLCVCLWKVNKETIQLGELIALLYTGITY